MLLRMKTQYAGPGGVCAPGRTIDVADNAEAYAMIEGGYAEQAEDTAPKRRKKEDETATAPATETAATRKPGPKSRVR